MSENNDSSHLLYVEGFTSPLELKNQLFLDGLPGPVEKHYHLRLEGFSYKGDLAIIGADSKERLVTKIIMPLFKKGEGYALLGIGYGDVRKVINPPFKTIPDLSFSDGKIVFAIFLEEAVIRKEGNPVELRYKCKEGCPNRTFTLENLEVGSITQARETLSQLLQFQKILLFKQSQHGGRPKRARPDKIKAKYNRMLNYRNSVDWRFRSDKDFLEHHQEYSRSSLQRAKKWNSEGRP